METDYAPSVRDDTYTDDEAAPLVAICNSDSSPKYNRATVLLLCGLLTVVADFGGSLTAAPEVRLLEMTVCRAFYALRDPSVIGPPPLGYVDESLCKVADIQVSLAYLRAWKRCLDSIPGYFYDVFSPESIWFGSLFLALGGGSRMLTAVLNSVIVDVCAEEKRFAVPFPCQLSTSTKHFPSSVVFYIFGAAIHITDIVALPLGSWFLSQDLWLPFKFCSPLMLLSFAIILLLPETMSLPQNPPLVNISRQDRERTHEVSNMIRVLAISLTIFY
ncbi:MFS transporter, putative [Metarhizium acridum CQMa 102]|uniref:MFS transporter, putative n=1 Tax=Metarhizium acridum (strain CQMa 102) TaxID=655827 RepID=E9E7P1_METAQ|nr:MFS transporter, putative [Metarhizium acridum CQMa 102]EFY88025.1 MFS transporter, putative [Metarhizium acridum CQMa 102]